MILSRASKPKRIAIVGAGPAGLACAVAGAERGHRVTLFEREAEVGGQFRFAREIPGKEEFSETLRYFRVRLERLGVQVLLGTEVSAASLIAQGYDEIVAATGVRARVPPIEGIEHPCVISYPDLLSGRRQAGERVAIIGAGGIGFDVATYLTCQRHADRTVAVSEFQREWGIDGTLAAAGGLLAAQPPVSKRKVWLLQRKAGKPGASLGVTTGWIHRRALQQRGVVMRGDIDYQRIDGAGLQLRTAHGIESLAVDSVIICAGQESETRLQTDLKAAAVPVGVIGGALLATEIDAERAIREGTELAARL